MELKQFISQALQDIIGGVSDAQEKVKNGSIIPNVAKTFQSVDYGISDIQTVEFEVSVTADKKTGSEAKLSVVAAVIGGNIKGKLDQSSSNVSKLSFKIPIQFPQHKSK
jgi:hypothetical protein